MPMLCELATLAHFHADRAVTPLHSNVIEAGPNSRADAAKEWYYQVEDDRKGPAPLLPHLCALPTWQGSLGAVSSELNQGEPGGQVAG